MISITGTTPDGKSERVIEIRREGAEVSLWIHSPRIDDGSAITVSLDELILALKKAQQK